MKSLPCALVIAMNISLEQGLPGMVNTLLSLSCVSFQLLVPQTDALTGKPRDSLPVKQTACFSQEKLRPAANFQLVDTTAPDGLVFK